MVNRYDYASGMAASSRSRSGTCAPLSGVSGRRGRSRGNALQLERLLDRDRVYFAEQRVDQPHQLRLHTPGLRIIVLLARADHLECLFGPHIGENRDDALRAERHQRDCQIVVAAPERQIVPTAAQDARGLRQAPAGFLDAADPRMLRQTHGRSRQRCPRPCGSGRCRRSPGRRPRRRPLYSVRARPSCVHLL